MDIQPFIDCLREKAPAHGLEIVDHNDSWHDALIVKVRSTDGRIGYVTASARELRMNQPKSACTHCGGVMSDGAMGSLVEARLANATKNMVA